MAYLVLPVSVESASLASPCLGSPPCHSDASCWLRDRYHTRRPKHALISKRYQLLGAASPYGLQHALCTLHLSCSPVRQISLRTHRSARGATLGSGGWLTLTTSGLSPDQICHAFPWRTNGIRMTRREAAGSMRGLGSFFTSGQFNLVEWTTTRNPIWSTKISS